MKVMQVIMMNSRVPLKWKILVEIIFWEVLTTEKTISLSARKLNFG